MLTSRGRYVAATSLLLGTAAVARRRRARLRAAAEGIRNAIQPGAAMDLPSDRPPTEDEAHAPGHRHLAVDGREHRPADVVVGRGPGFHRR